MEITIAGKTLRLMQGDITKVPADAIANAANSSLAGGGGVDGAIHRAGGPAIMKELDGMRKEIGRCPTGSAVATTAGNLPAKWVLHAVGPIYGSSSEQATQLASCYQTCLRLAEERGAQSITFPSISTGVYGYPLDEAAPIAIDAVARHLRESAGSVNEVTFVLFDARTMSAYERAVRGTLE
ncbi:MAG: O-acetyl-ADP-ribose deacetylase [Bryobacteraceae bacterium]